MPENPLSGRRYDRLMSEIKHEGARQFESLIRDKLADSYPPGTVRVTEPARQAELMRGLQAGGSNLGPNERRVITRARSF